MHTYMPGVHFKFNFLSIGSNTKMEREKHTQARSTKHLPHLLCTQFTIYNQTEVVAFVVILLAIIFDLILNSVCKDLLIICIPWFRWIKSAATKTRGWNTRGRAHTDTYAFPMNNDKSYLYDVLVDIGHIHTFSFTSVVANWFAEKNNQK